MKKFNYFPLLKTRDAELKAMSKFDSKYFDETLPIYELTKSRNTKIAPDGDIHRKMNSIRELQGERPFILDLTSNDKYINPQIEQLLDERNGYYEWRYFLNIYDDLNVIPMIHIYDEDDFIQVRAFVTEVSKQKNHLAIRLPCELDGYEKYINPVIESLHENCKLFIILDGGQVNIDNVNDIRDYFINACNELNDFSSKIEDVVIVTTSFPLSPAKLGEDHQGNIPILEEVIYAEVSEEFPVKYGDYASINIQQVEIKGGTFVPRIDIALLDEDKFIYKRYRRNSGSYPLCAQEMLSDDRYKKLNIWADNEIKLAAEDNPSGISPSFWIAVRMNYFMTTRVILRTS